VALSGRIAVTHPPSNPASRSVAAWQRAGVFAAGAALLGSGGLWLAVHYAVGLGAGELPHPLEAWMLRLHGFAAFAALFLMGAVAAAHVPHGWRLSRRPRRAGQRRTGVALLACAGLLGLSGYLLYYFAPEAWRPALGWAHTATGAAMALLLAIHRQAGSTR
jgi:hypothetical protein